MRERMRPTDTLFIYFSGNGKRLARAGVPAGCQEGLITVEGRQYWDDLFREDLEELAASVNRVIVFNDSCHSGGAVTKSLRIPEKDEPQVKAYPVELTATPKGKGGTANDADEVCARQVNTTAKSFRGMAPATKMFYLAASADNEAAYATSQGSQATRAWHFCLQSDSADTNRDGQISGQELAVCAQAWMDANQRKWPQTITPQMNISLVIARSSSR
jgi:metacaspase-1